MQFLLTILVEDTEPIDICNVNQDKQSMRLSVMILSQCNFDDSPTLDIYVYKRKKASMHDDK